jgi:hypothetical protein
MALAPGSRPRRGRRPDSPGSKTRGTSRIDDRTPEGCHNPVGSPDSATPAGSALDHGFTFPGVFDPGYRIFDASGVAVLPAATTPSRGTSHPRATTQ